MNYLVISLIKWSFFLALVVVKVWGGERPNVVVIFADDMGYGDVSCYDLNSKIKTPCIDQLASDGMKFLDAHTASAVCTPSRYALLTGRYAWRTSLKKGVLKGHSKPLIDADRMTLGTLFQKEGYKTACIGKWHLGMNFYDSKGGTPEGIDTYKVTNVDYGKQLSETPTSRGFDYYWGISASLDMPPYIWIENNKATALPDSGYRVKGGRSGDTAKGWRHEEVMPTIADKAIEFIHKNRDESFFVYIPLNSPHTPHAPSSSFVGKSGLDTYGDFMMEVDYTIGRIIDSIDSLGLKENTIVVLTSDNGPEINMYERRSKTGHDSSSHWLGGKRDNWEGGHRVPFIVRWPGVVEEESINNDLIGTVDLMATFSEILGSSIPDHAAEDSLSFLPLLKNEKRDASDHSWIFHSSEGHFAIRKGDWKLLLHRGSGGNDYERLMNVKKWTFLRDTPEEKGELKTAESWQLYDLKNDAGETVNLYQSMPEIANRLKLEALKIIESGRSTPGTKQDYVSDNWEQVERLK